MPGPKNILEIVERFREHEEEYRNPAFNETQTRIQFLDPFYEALGWDMQNKQGYAEAYNEVMFFRRTRCGDSDAEKGSEIFVQ